MRRIEILVLYSTVSTRRGCLNTIQLCGENQLVRVKKNKTTFTQDFISRKRLKLQSVIFMKSNFINSMVQDR